MWLRHKVMGLVKPRCDAKAVMLRSQCQRAGEAQQDGSSSEHDRSERDRDEGGGVCGVGGDRQGSPTI
jgi:hypothetical protein